MAATNRDWAALAPDVLTLVLHLTGRDRPDALMSTLCIASLDAVRRQLSETVAFASVPPALTAAAAYLAAAGWIQGDGADSLSLPSVKLGEVSVSPAEPAGLSGRIGHYRAEAVRLMEPYLPDRGFAFRGV